MANFVYIAVSLDGFIARTDGSIDWLTAIPNEEGSDYGYGQFMAGIDAVVMGRKTFETVLGFGEWPYTKPVFVLSRSLGSLPVDTAGRASVLSGEPEAIVAELGRRGFRNLYIDGGRTIQAFLERDMVDELTLTSASVVLGGGIPLFGSLPRELSLRLGEVRRLNDHLVQCRYTRPGEASSGKAEPGPGTPAR